MTRRRITKDEEDVQSMINTITVNSWEFDPENTKKDPLLNIDIGLVPRPDVAKFLPKAREQGQKATNDIIDHNLDSDEKSFWPQLQR